MAFSSNHSIKFSVNVNDLIIERLIDLLGTPCKLVSNQKNRFLVQLPEYYSEDHMKHFAEHLNTVIMTSAEPKNQLKILADNEAILKALSGLQSMNKPHKIYFKPSPLMQIFAKK